MLLQDKTMEETKRAPTTQDVAARFNELAQQGKFFEIQDELFADNVRSVEPPTAKHLRNAEGKAAVRRKGEDWIARVETVHSVDVSRPIVSARYFAVVQENHITVKGLGRIHMDQINLYEVRDGKIVLEQFFY